MTYSEEIQVKTRGYHKEFDLTDRINQIVEDAGIQTGHAHIFCPHTTCTFIMNESERGFLNDLHLRMDQVAPKSAAYAHDSPEYRPDMPEDERINGFAHLQVELFGTRSLYLPVREGKLRLGTFQRIFLYECDGAREREVWVQVSG